MVFCGTRRNVDFIADNLIRKGISAKAIHGGLEQKRRIKVLEEFHKKGLGVLVCTDVAARGLDIKGVSHVYNYDIPAYPKDYIHRVGRTARAGEEGKAITILARRDYEKFRVLMQSEEIKIIPKEIPELEIVSVHFNSERNNKFNRSPNRRNFNRRPRRDNRDSPREAFRRNNRNNSRNNRDNQRNSNRDSYAKRQNSRRTVGRDSKNNSIGNFNRGPRRDNSRRI